jgi:hypothetical protein
MPTASMPNSWIARMIRMAISPLLATKIFVLNVFPFLGGRTKSGQ